MQIDGMKGTIDAKRAGVQHADAVGTPSFGPRV